MVVRIIIDRRVKKGKEAEVFDLLKELRQCSSTKKAEAASLLMKLTLTREVYHVQAS